MRGFCSSHRALVLGRLCGSRRDRRQEEKLSFWLYKRSFRTPIHEFRTSLYISLTLNSSKKLLIEVKLWVRFSSYSEAGA
jgi:hypothetical protein